MSNPLISIITITYNAEKELPVTMDSVMSQTYRNFEHLIIDGASTDHTLEIARKSPEARIMSERDNGLYDAMNKGLSLARGKYVLFLNAGDSFRSPETLSLYASEAEKDRDIIYADTMIVDSNREDIGPRHYSAPLLLTHESFSKGMLICHQAFMVKKEIAPQYDLQYRFSADYDWTIKCIRNTEPERCVNLNTVAINYLSDGMTDKNKFKSLKERYKVMAHHYGTLSAIKRHIALLLGKR
ncbi:MAG: glycosyltransferase [Muribaculaceae bacterium]|nr:glycosyltransferase [Muribaculaceae bacterium]